MMSSVLSHCLQVMSSGSVLSHLQAASPGNVFAQRPLEMSPGNVFVQRPLAMSPGYVFRQSPGCVCRQRHLAVSPGYVFRQCPCAMSPIYLCVSDRSRCGAVRIFYVADEPSAACGNRACRIALAVAPCAFSTWPPNPLRGSCVSDRFAVAPCETSPTNPLRGSCTLAVAPCISATSPTNPLQGSCVSKCSRVRIYNFADEHFTGILCVEALSLWRCANLSRSRNPLQGSCASDIEIVFKPLGFCSNMRQAAGFNAEPLGFERKVGSKSQTDAEAHRQTDRQTICEVCMRRPGDVCRLVLQHGTCMLGMGCRSVAGLIRLLELWFCTLSYLYRRTVRVAKREAWSSATHTHTKFLQTSTFALATFSADVFVAQLRAACLEQPGHAAAPFVRARPESLKLKSASNLRQRPFSDRRGQSRRVGGILGGMAHFRSADRCLGGQPFLQQLQVLAQVPPRALQSCSWRSFAAWWSSGRATGWLLFVRS